MTEIAGATSIDVPSPDEIVFALDQLDPATEHAAMTARGYQVKVKLQTLSPSEVAEKRAVVAEVVARSLKCGKKDQKT